MPDDEVLVPLLHETVEVDRVDEVFTLLEQMGAYHPTAPHWYLPLIGVDPRHQGQGLGSAMLEKIADAIRHGPRAALTLHPPHAPPRP